MNYKKQQSHRIIIFLFLCFSTLLLRAQVTVGSGEEPVTGALLQLKNMEGITTGEKNSTKGMMLPRVELEGVYDAKIGGETDFSSGKMLHTGLVVYNLYDNTANETDSELQLCPGPYVWNGTKWIRMWGPCSSGSTPTPAGYIECGHNLTKISVSLCQNVRKPGSFSLTAYEDAVISIKDGDILGSGGGFNIVAVKDVAGSGDTDTYTVMKNNSPVDINVIVEGTSNTAGNIDIPIDLSGFISGTILTEISGCPDAVVTVTENKMIADPSTIIFTSGQDGLSRGYQAVNDDKGTAVRFSAIQRVNISDHFLDNDNYLVRPWGIDGINADYVLFGTTFWSGTTKADVTYWPFKVSWAPVSSSVTVNNPVSADKTREPEFTLKFSNGSSLTATSAGSDNCGNSYSEYALPGEQKGMPPVWYDFIEMKSIDQALKFQPVAGGGGGETFNISEPYTLSKTITLTHSEGETKQFDIRQIHYGVLMLDINDNPIESTEDGGRADIYNYNPAGNNYEFKFKIKSNVKWEVTSSLSALMYQAGPNNFVDVLESVENLVGEEQTPPYKPENYYGPEEDAYGEPRTRVVTVKFKDTLNFDDPEKDYISISVTLYNAKLVDDTWAGTKSLMIKLHKKAAP